MQTLERKIAVPSEGEVSSVWNVPEHYTAQRNIGLILAHGAGNDMNSPFLSFVHETLAQRGLMTVKFNFPYKERGLMATDRPPVLEATWRAVIASVRNEPDLAPQQYSSRARVGVGGSLRR